LVKKATLGILLHDTCSYSCKNAAQALITHPLLLGVLALETTAAALLYAIAAAQSSFKHRTKKNKLNKST